MICRIADFDIEFQNPSDKMKWFLKDYSTDAQPQFSLSVSKTDIDHIRNITNIPLDALQLEAAAFHEKLLATLSQNDAIFFHASLIDVNGVGVAFAALSGTGKTTQTLLWKKLLGDKMQIINGDKPIIRFLEDIPYGYGTPWNGKEHLGTTGKTPLKHICFIERNDKNLCEQITPERALERIFSQIFIPKDTVTASKTLELLNRLFKNCTVWNIKCNMDIEAAQVAFDTIFKEK